MSPEELVKCIRFPEEVVEVVREVVKNCPDVEDAKEEAKRKCRGLPSFRKYVDALVDVAIQELVYELRHLSTRQDKRDAGEYGGESKVTVGSSRSVREACSLYSTFIGGNQLGLILGEDLKDLADQESQIGEGHLVNAALLRSLSRIVPEGKRVQDAVKPAKLFHLYERAKAEASRRVSRRKAVPV